jgi:hypothetical protein
LRKYKYSRGLLVDFMLSGEERGERREVDCKFTPNAQEQKNCDRKSTSIPNCKSLCSRYITFVIHLNIHYV